MKLSAALSARAVVAAIVVSSVTLSGCASTPSDPRDPLEPMNRAFYAFNRAADQAVINPVARGYRDYVPQPIRTGVNNFFENINDIWRAVNGLLQGDVPRAFDYVGRFFINTTIGIGGIFDVATDDLGLKGGPNDLGMTFAKWGIQDGPYLEIPLFGPSTVRDGIGFGIESYFDPLFWALDPAGAAWQYGQFVVRYVNARSRLLDTEQLIGDALDPYAFRRDSYFQYRRSLNAPTGKSERAELDESLPLEPAASPASSASPESDRAVDGADRAPEQRVQIEPAALVPDAAM